MYKADAEESGGWYRQHGRSQMCGTKPYLEPTVATALHCLPGAVK